MNKIIGNQNFNTSSHCVFRLTYHVVWCVKFRRHILTALRRGSLFKSLSEIAQSVNCKILEINGEEDHIHFILETPPTINLSETIGKLKSKSAHDFIEQFGSFLSGKLSRTLWSSGFFIASTGGVTLDVLKAYLSNQRA